jgi:hypothetical protein
MAVTGVATRVIEIVSLDDFTTTSLEISFAPSSIEAHGVLTMVAVADDLNFVAIELARFRTRKADGSDKTHVIASGSFDSASMFADKCTSVTFLATCSEAHMTAVPTVTFLG